MKKIDARTDRVVVGEKPWASLMQQQLAESGPPKGSKQLGQIQDELRESGLPCGEHCARRFVVGLIKTGLAAKSVHTVNGRLQTFYTIKENSK